ncbi:myotubularin-related protein 4-like isoform X2 [Dinothrombium tinctorium]|uniref:Myotubularin-related protein 4-like isoform X2 n=1 Tax=Dinothrombium tinctorium TaxID=1965070 RepID=A0A3S3P946_9ACAR|nr:myotubularin-related protein 4-like isoform X2 [Dinothrombium tinctorium]
MLESKSVEDELNLVNHLQIQSTLEGTVLSTSSASLNGHVIKAEATDTEITFNEVSKNDGGSAAMDNCNSNEQLLNAHSGTGEPVNDENYDPLSSEINGIKFPKLRGELFCDKCNTTDGMMILTNYRIFLSYNDATITPVSLPFGAIETVEIRDLLFLNIHTKLARSLLFSFSTTEECSKWMSKITDALSLQSKLDDLFCFKFFKASLIARNDEDLRSLVSMQALHKNLDSVNESFSVVQKEFKRMGFNTCWRISDVNKDFELCTSYPRYLIVPQKITDTELELVAKFRYSKRIPAVVWRYRKNGCVIARSSQPEVGWLGWRNNYDEALLQNIVSSCFNNDQIASSKKLLILDARSYAAAVANRAKGGGCECPEYYPCCEVQFMSLANIHTIRKSFNTLRYICETSADQVNWLTLLDSSKWLHHMSSLIKSALIVVNAIDEEERPVLVHCSDGWDRTPQIVALSELMLDPFYRTIDGFRVLVEREWCEFGHKFSERCGNAPTSDESERCPVFLQWLDCVHQLVRQFPCSFEFTLQYLEKLALHTYSCLFSTFICNNMHERFVHQVNERSHSIWSYITESKHNFTNYLYCENEQVLKPSFKIKHMFFWTDVYGPLASHTQVNTSTTSTCGIYSSAGNSTASDVKKDLNADLKNTDSDTNTNEIESDLETVSSEKHSNLVKTQSCDNVNSLEDLVIHTELNTRNRHHSESDLLRSLCIINTHEATEGLIEDMHSKESDKYKEMESNQQNCDRDCINQLPTDENRDNRVNEDNSCRETNDNKSAQECVQSELLDQPLILTDSCKISSSVANNQSSLAENFTSNGIANELNIGSHIFSDAKTFDNQNCFSTQFCGRKMVTRQPSESQFIDEATEISTANGKHTRTPSSGCPATPNDDQCSDISGTKFDSMLGMNQVFDIDGQVVVIDEVQMRVRQFVMKHKAEVEALRKDLYMSKLALCQQINYSWKGGKSNDEHSMVNECQNQPNSDNVSNNSSLDTSWVNIQQFRPNAADLANRSDGETDNCGTTNVYTNGVAGELTMTIFVNVYTIQKNLVLPIENATTDDEIVTS